MSSLNVVTFNLLNKPSRWHERRHLVVAELAQLQPDVIALQEVSLPNNTAQWLANRLGGYSVHLCSKTGKLEGKEGIAILSRLPVEEVATLDLGSQCRVAQLARVRCGARPAVIVNGHFYFHLLDPVERHRQIERLLSWLAERAPDGPAVVCGDFNSTPESRSIELMRERFVSAHLRRHGREPEYTCPTPLAYGLSPMRKTLLRLGNFALNRSFEPWRGTVDYIFVQPGWRVLDCRRVLHKPAEHDHTLYPSDHVGLTATLALP
jgi:endonuclease/exonuclease/phosphatase family metal-dependent hydrolase